MAPVLEINGLKTHFFTDVGVAKAVDGISLSLPGAKTLALVGESGCGKSVTALSVMRLIPEPPGRIVEVPFTLMGRTLDHRATRRCALFGGTRSP